MREIKFSYIAQHEETGLFMEQIFTMEEIEGSDFLNQWRKTFKRFGKWISRRQFTGLKDKNGKEIYEGDIVEWTIFPDESDPMRIKDSVAFSNGCFKVERRCELLGLKEPHRQIEVIGNIYENPELIKK